MANQAAPPKIKSRLEKSTMSERDTNNEMKSPVAKIGNHRSSREEETLSRMVKTAPNRKKV